MAFIEFIGFIIAMVAFFFLVGKQAREKRERQRHPEKYEEGNGGQEEALGELLESLGIQMKKKVPKIPPPPPKPPKEEPERLAEETPVFSVHAKKRGFKDDHTKGAYKIVKQQQSLATKALKDVGSLKQAIILREIFGPPKGL